MAQPNKFEYRLNFGGIDEEILSQAPENWLNTTIKYTRSKVYGGLFRGETSPTPFVTKAAFLLRQAFYKTGINSFVKVAVNLLNNSNWQYFNIFSGVLDFSTVVDSITNFTINAISDDFSVQLNANDSTTYAIPFTDPTTGLDVAGVINLELTPLSLKEQADFIFNTTPDFRANAFFEISVVNNQQNSVNNSVQSTGFLATIFPATPVFDDTNGGEWFYVARINTNVRLTGNIACSVNSGHYKFNIYKTGGTLIRTLSEVTNSITLQNNFSWDFVVPLNQGERLFFYIERLDSPNTTPGVNMQSGTMHLEYDTISPATMCKAMPMFYVVKYLLQAMNTNQDSGPNQPVPFKSDLLSSSLSNLVVTSSDSIKTALGSLSMPGDTLFPGSYQVVSGPIVYNGSTYNVGDTFPYNPSVLTFTGSGIVEKITSGFVGAVYNPGDTLEAGGTYLVGGNPGTGILYNGIAYLVGEFFKWVLGFDTFTASDDSSFVEQTGISPQILITFRDTFQSILSIQGGNCAFGIENIAGVDTCFIENLDYIYRGTVGNLDVGVVDKDIKITPATDIIGNTLVVGYKDQQYSQLNGFSEVNSQQNYATSLVVPKKEINLVSVFRADPYGIEEIRVSQNDTASSRSDNDTFMIWKKTLPENTVAIPNLGFYYHPLRTEGLQINPTTSLPMITGVDPSYYNWKISPKRNLVERGGNYLSSMYYGMQGYKITLSGATKNTGLVTTDINGLIIAEAEPVLISTLPKPLFIPMYVSCKPGMPTNALQMIDNLPYGFIKFTFNNKQFQMFADTISVDVGENSEQEIKGLLTPNNDLTQLIR